MSNDELPGKLGEMLVEPCEGLAFHPRGRGDTPSDFMLRKLELAPTGWVSNFLHQADLFARLNIINYVPTRPASSSIAFDTLITIGPMHFSSDSHGFMSPWLVQLSSQPCLVLLC